MTAPTFFTVVADYKSVVVDLASDVDADPQLGPITAKVTFTPVLANGDVILATNASPRPTGYLAAGIVARIDDDGRVKLRVEPDGDRDDFATTAAFPATGNTAKVYFAINTQTFYRWTGSAYAATYPYAAVRLLADTPLLELNSPLYYRVTFSDVVFNGASGYIAPFVFQAPTSDVELNLIEVTPVPGQPASGQTKIAPGAVRVVDGNKLQFSFAGVDIPEPLDVNITAAVIEDSGTVGRALVQAETAAAARTALNLGVFDARDYGVIADGAPHNNVANLLDCFAQCSAAGGGTVVLPAGVIDTSDAVAWVTLTANSGRSYQNRGGIPMFVDKPLTVRGGGTGVTTVKLSAGFPRLFDLPMPFYNAPVNFRDITISDLTVDGNNLTGLSMGPLTTVSSAVTLAPGVWTTIPGISATTFKNCRLTWLPDRNTGFVARVSGSNFQLQNQGATSFTIASGNTIRGSHRNHVLLGTYIDGGSVASGWNTNINNLSVRNIDTINVITSPSTTGLATPNNPDFTGSIRFFHQLVALTNADMTPSITNCEFRNLRLNGGNAGIDINGGRGTWIDNVWIYDSYHDTEIVGAGNYTSANFMIGQYSWVGRVGLVRCHGKNSGDVALELDQPWEAYEIDCLWEDSFNGNYSTSFVIPAKTAAGPQASALSGAINDSVTTATFIVPGDVARAGLAKIDSELVWYSMAAPWPTTPGTDLSLTLVRGFNGTTAASHSSGAVVTFVETEKTRINSIRSSIRNSAASMNGNPGGSPGYIAFENDKLPVPPITIRDSSIESVGGDYQESQFVYWSGWRPDFNIQGLRIVHDGLVNPQATASDNRAKGSAISWRWDWGSTFNYAVVPSFRYPRVYGRDVQVRVHGTSKLFESYVALSPQRGLALLDMDIDAEVVTQFSSPVSTFAVALAPPNNWDLQLAPGSRLGITVSGGFAGSDPVPCGLIVGSSSDLKINGVLDVDIDASRLTHGGGAGDGNYMPWRIDSTNVGKIRFGKVRHSLRNTGKYPSQKQFVAFTSTSYTVAADDEIVQVDTTAGPVTVTLPRSTGGSAELGEPLMRGRLLTIIDTGFAAGSNAITITPHSTDKINNGTAGASVTITTNGGSVSLLATSSTPGWAYFVNKSTVGLSNVDNTSNATERAAVATLSNKTLSTPRVDSLLDTNGVTGLTITPIASAVNAVRIIPNTTGQPARIQAVGEANAALTVMGRGTSGVAITDSLQATITNFSKSTTPVNYLTVTSSDTGAAVPVGVAGSDTNIGLNLITKNAGIVQANGNPVETTNNKGVANGYASLDSGGKVPVTQLPNSIMEYQGTWNASTNTPTLANGTGSAGDVYRVSVAGTSLGLTFDVGDYVIYNGTTWEKSDTTDAVASVAGRTGNVTLTSTDVGLGNVNNTSNTTERAATASLTNKDLTSGTNTFPTFNQNTTGSAATLTTVRTIDGQSFNGSADITVIAPGTFAATAKATPVDADVIPLADSAASNVLKKLSWANLVATLKTYFDSVSTTLSAKTLSAPVMTGTTKVAQSGVLEIYNTADQTTNYERATFNWSGNVFYINNQNAGTGSLRQMRVGNANNSLVVAGSAQSTGTVSVFALSSFASAAVFGIGGTLSSNSGTQTCAVINTTISQTSTAGYTALLINPTETTTGSGTKRLIDAQVGGSTKFTVDNTGTVSISGTAATIRAGAGSPEGVVTANVGSMYTRTDGGAGTTLYVKESGAGNTGWVAK